MVKQPKYDYKIFLWLLIFLALGGAGIVGLFDWSVSIWNWFLAEERPDPVSPPATKLGTEPTFDAILTKADQEWSFLFEVNRQDVIASDIYGRNDSVILNIKEATGNDNSEILYESISPDGRLLAINYYNERDAIGDWHPPIGKLMVVNIADGTVEHIPTSLEGFVFDWGSSVHWLSPDIFLVTMHKFVGADMSSEKVAFLRYDLQAPLSFQPIEFDPCSFLRAVTKDDSRVLLLFSACGQSSVWAIDTDGKRPATSEETVFFNHYYFDCHRDEICVQQFSDDTFPSITTARVVGDTIEGFGRFFEHNSNRYYIYRDDQIVRVADGGGDKVIWDTTLDLFFWDEAEGIFQMDRQGHYNFWHAGDYLGKIPKSILDDK